MARPVTWLTRLSAIRRSVSESIRSHYSTKDLQQLFEIQPRSAQMLASLIPTVSVGNAKLIERQALSSLLDQLAVAADPGATLATMRRQPRPQIVRRKLRELIRTDVLAGKSGLPINVNAERGLLAIRFADMEQLATALHAIANLLENDLEGFALSYEPEEVSQISSLEDERERDDVEYIRGWLAVDATEHPR